MDLSAPQIVGAWLSDRSRAPLRKLARSTSVWERRIAIIATYYFIRRHELEDTFGIAHMLLNDPRDLIHKAAGWMLREAGKRDPAAEHRFLVSRHTRMPADDGAICDREVPREGAAEILEGSANHADGLGGEDCRTPGPRKVATVEAQRH